MKKALVTGANGFVGSAVVRELLSHGEAVKGLVRDGCDCRNLEELDVELFYGDIMDPASLEVALEGCDRVYHAAALHTLFGPRERFYEVNVIGTRNVLRAALDAGVERVVHTSSVSAIGAPGPDESFSTEDTIWRSGEFFHPYVHTKFLAEFEAWRIAAQGLPVVVVNPGGAVGEGDIKPTPTGELVLRYLRGELPGAPGIPISLVDVRDVAHGQRLAMERGQAGHRYILSAENTTLGDLVRVLAEMLGRPGPAIPVPWLALAAVGHLISWLPGAGGAHFVVERHAYDSAKAREELGMTFGPVREALRREVAWFQSNGYVSETSAKATG